METSKKFSPLLTFLTDIKYFCFKKFLFSGWGCPGQGGGAGRGGQVPGEEHVGLRHRLLQLRWPRHRGGREGPRQKQPGWQEASEEGVLCGQITSEDIRSEFTSHFLVIFLFPRVLREGQMIFPSKMELWENISGPLREMSGYKLLVIFWETFHKYQMTFNLNKYIFRLEM